jgi:peptide deformylase
MVESFGKLGILQRGDSRLLKYSRPFNLPAEGDEAIKVAQSLVSILSTIWKTQSFPRGLGIAAPQIAIPRSSFAVRLGADHEPEVFINPQVVQVAEEELLDYEGCLSFWNVRGAVRRPAWVIVRWHTVEFSIKEAQFVGDQARLIFHEIDHLWGNLYSMRMPESSRLLSMEEYAVLKRQVRLPHMENCH